MKTVAAVIDKKGENAVKEVAVMLDVLGRRGADSFCIATPNNTAIESSLERLPVEEFESSTALGHVFLKILAGDAPQLAQFEKSTILFDGRIYNPRLENLKAIFAEKRQVGGASALIEGAIRGFDGFFAILAAENAENDRLVVGRDPLGLYPLYYGENDDFFAVASERKAL